MANITGAKTALKPMVFELDIVQSPPALILLINPESLDLKFTPKVTEARTRWTDRRQSAYIFHAHHDELDMLSAAGKSAMFYDSNGLTSGNRTESLAWDNIQKLLAIYRNNGMNFNSKPNSISSVIDFVGRVVITYDGYIYRGSFESFSISEAQEKPHNVEFNFEFKVTQIYNIGGASNKIMQNYLARKQ